jgi:uncharacterized protein YbjT (DUF2867 family)
VRVILFGATGMVGQGVLRECVLEMNVESVLSVVRRASVAGQEKNQKVRELVTDDFYDFSGMASEFAGYDACFFCLGVSALGMKEAEYRRVTYDITMAAAKALVKANPAMTLIYVSGAGTDANGRQMWARVKGETENALLGMGFRAAYMFRPGAIVPLHGITSKTKLYRVVYTVLAPFLPFLLKVFPKYVTTTEQVGRAMLGVLKRGYPKQILEAVDIVTASERRAEKRR